MMLSRRVSCGRARCCAPLALRDDPRVRAFQVEAENFESIHNHSAFARIAHPDQILLATR